MSHPELQGLSGGRKQHWLNSHRAEVLNYYRQHGESQTMLEYFMSNITLARFLTRQNEPAKFTEYDKITNRAEMTEEAVRELRRELNDMRKQYGQFTEIVSEQLLDRFIKPLLAHAIRLPDEFRSNFTNPIALENFLPKVSEGNRKK